MKWDLPSFAHIPLIHTTDGKKLSKRDKASTLDDYSNIGIMPEALRNYLLRLGWSYKDKEIFTKEESIKHFNLEGIGKSPSKLDMSRILSMNEHYIKSNDENELFNLQLKGIVPIIAHPERYRGIQKDINLAKKWIDRGYFIQIDCASIIGGFGKETQAAAIKLLKNGLCHLIVSDAHNDKSRNFFLKQAL